MEFSDDDLLSAIDAVATKGQAATSWRVALAIGGGTATESLDAAVAGRLARLADAGALQRLEATARWAESGAPLLAVTAYRRAGNGAADAAPDAMRPVDALDDRYD